MTRLPHLEAALIAAAERLEQPHAGATSRAAHSLNGSGRGLRAAWRRRGRRGHGALGLAGALVLAGGATGAAQVAGLDPFGYLTSGAHQDPRLQPAAGPDHLVEARTAAGASPSWLVRAYVTKSGQLCIKGGRAEGNGYSGSCWSSDEVAQIVADPNRPKRVLEYSTTVKGPPEHPRRVVVFGVVADGLPGLDVDVQGYPTAAAKPAPGVLRLAVDKRPDGLNAAGRRYLATLPDQLVLRMYGLETPVPKGMGNHRYTSLREDTTTEPTAPPRLVLEVPGSAPVQRRRSPRAPHRRLLQRTPTPVLDSTAHQRELVPALGLPRTASDALPSRLLTPQLIQYRAQPAQARRLTPASDAGLGPIWVLPGALPEQAYAPSIEGAICLAGPRVLSGCLTTQPRGPLPAIEAVVCSPGLDPDLLLTWGFVPAGAARARIAFADGARRTVAVRELLLVKRSKRAPLVTSVTWIGHGIHRTQRVPFPKNSATAKCVSQGQSKGRYRGTYVEWRVAIDRSGEVH